MEWLDEMLKKHKEKVQEESRKHKEEQQQRSAQLRDRRSKFTQCVNDIIAPSLRTVDKKLRDEGFKSEIYKEHATDLQDNFSFYNYYGLYIPIIKNKVHKRYELLFSHNDNDNITVMLKEDGNAILHENVSFESIDDYYVEEKLKLLMKDIL